MLTEFKPATRVPGPGLPDSQPDGGTVESSSVPNRAAKACTAAERIGLGVDRFLEEGRNVGQHDSVGCFQLSGEQALSKLGRFSVSRPEQWILKMVQAAVAGGATRLDITQSRRETRLVFGLSHLPAPDELEHALLAPESPATPFLTELTIGLRSLLSTRRLSVIWPGEDEGCLRWNGQSLLRETSSSAGASFEVVVEASHQGWLGGQKERAAESRALQTEAAYCPIPLWLDNREVTVCDLAVQSIHKCHGEASPMHFACGYLSEPQGEGEPAVSTRTQNPLRTSAPLMRWSRGDRADLGSFSLFASRSGNAKDVDETFRFIWTRYGVACAVREHDSAPLGGFLQLPGDHLRTDLSGLSLHVEPEALREAYNSLARLRGPTISALAWLEGFRPLATYGELAARVARGTGMGLVKMTGWMALIAAMSIPIVGEIVAGFGDQILEAKNHERKRRLQVEKWTKVIERRWNRMVRLAATGTEH